MLIAFTVSGIPSPQGSLRHVGRGRMIYTDKLIEWRNSVIKATERMAETVDVIDYPIYVRLEVRVPRPKSVKRAYPLTRSSGDLDKHQRCIGDALVLGGLISDDSIILDWRASKRYSTDPGVTIYIDPIRELN